MLYQKNIASNMATKPADVTYNGTYGAPNPTGPPTTEQMLRRKKSRK